jgi:hypothetical protein
MAFLFAPMVTQDIGGDPEEQRSGTLGLQLKPVTATPSFEKNGGCDILGELLSGSTPETVGLNGTGVPLIELTESGGIPVPRLCPQPASVKVAMIVYVRRGRFGSRASAR